MRQICFAGAVKLGSDCDKEQDVAIYLFVKSIQGALFWVAILLLGLRGDLKKAIMNPCFETYIYLQTLFAAVWFIIGKNISTFGICHEIRSLIIYSVDLLN